MNIEEAKKILDNNVDFISINDIAALDGDFTIKDLEAVIVILKEGKTYDSLA